MSIISDFCRSAPILGLLLGAGLLVGCGDGDSGSVSIGTEAGNEAGSSEIDGKLQAWVEALEAGQSTLTLRGAVTSTGEYTVGEDPRYPSNVDVFRPGRGGGAARRGSNAEGPYALTIYTDAIREDNPEQVVPAWLSMVLPAGAEAGRSYSIAGFREADDHQVQAHVQGDGMAWTYARRVSGELYLAELGEQASAAWRLEFARGGGEEPPLLTVEGAVNGLAFTPQREARYDLTVNGDTESYLRRVALNESGSSIMLIIGNGIYLYLPLSLETGEYPLASRLEDGAIRVQLTSHDTEAVEGTLILSERDGLFDAEIEFEATGADEVSLVGELELLGIERGAP